MNNKRSMRTSIWFLLIRVAIVAIPTYAVAILTERMVYVVPTLVISGLISNHFQGELQNRNTSFDKDIEFEVDGDRPSDHHLNDES